MTWAIWATVITITDFFSLMVALHLLPSTFPASSGNFNLVFHFLEHYQINNFLLTCVLFIIINLWILIIAISFWQAIITFHKQYSMYYYKAIIAFMLNMSMTAFFMIMDEVFIQYKAGHSHMGRLLFMFVTFLGFIYLNDLSKKE